eukprot:m.94488 g.94488  ORF g.94488 m.94488 type:complete len:117 (+) comp8573_c0_seq1:1246-1596(+)
MHYNRPRSSQASSARLAVTIRSSSISSCQMKPVSSSTSSACSSATRACRGISVMHVVQPEISSQSIKFAPWLQADHATISAVLAALRAAIARLHARGLFPFTPTALLRRLDAVLSM